MSRTVDIDIEVTGSAAEPRTEGAAFSCRVRLANGEELELRSTGGRVVLPPGSTLLAMLPPPEIE